MTILITLAIAALTLRALCRDAPRAPEPEPDFLAVRAKAKPKVARKRP